MYMREELRTQILFVVTVAGCANLTLAAESAMRDVAE